MFNCRILRIFLRYTVLRVRCATLKVRCAALKVLRSAFKVRCAVPKGCLTLLALLFAVSITHGQGCPQYPAICPDLRTDPGSADDSVSRLDNPVLPGEVAMENRLRLQVTAQLNDIARKEGWELTEIYEALASGYRDSDGSVLVYERRPAHWVHMVWQFIVNKDSMQAWRDWLKDLGQRRLDQTNQYASRITSKQDAIQAYMDSANYWGNLMVKYTQDHMAQYQKDLLAGNKTGIATYEKGVEVYRRRQNNFINKAGDLQKDSQGDKESADGDKENKIQQLRFYDACIVVVEFDFNGNLVETDGNKRTPPAGSPPAVKWYTLSEPDQLDAVNYFRRSHNMALWMVGNWNPTPDGYAHFNAGWTADKSNTKGVTIKKIKSDKVQNLFVRVSGDAAAMRRILTDLSAGELEKWITR